jgi:hypothetical protein
MTQSRFLNELRFPSHGKFDAMVASGCLKLGALAHLRCYTTCSTPGSQPCNHDAFQTLGDRSHIILCSSGTVSNLVAVLCVLL